VRGRENADKQNAEGAACDDEDADMIDGHVMPGAHDDETD
jgi:hypothetical protein